MKRRDAFIPPYETWADALYNCNAIETEPTRLGFVICRMLRNSYIRDVTEILLPAGDDEYSAEWKDSSKTAGWIRFAEKHRIFAAEFGLLCG